jgi:hypothetical protein
MLPCCAAAAAACGCGPARPLLQGGLLCCCQQLCLLGCLQRLQLTAACLQLHLQSSLTRGASRLQGTALLLL